MRRPVFLLASTVLALLFASGVVLVEAEKPAQAAFPGQNAKIAFERNGAIYSMDADGSQQTKIKDGQDPAWSADGTKLAFVAQWDVYVMYADGRSLTRLADAPCYRWGCETYRMPAWSPDGSKLATTWSEYEDSYFSLQVITADGNRVGGPISAGNGSEYGGHSSWSPDGSKIAFGEQTWDNNGSLAVINSDFSDKKYLIEGGGSSHLAPSWSPDGTKIAFQSNRDGNNEIYVMNADGSEQTRLTYTSGSDTEPEWSPDGTKIAFSSSRDGDAEIYVMNADGAEQTRLTYAPGPDTGPSWQPYPGESLPPDTMVPDTSVVSGPQGLVNTGAATFGLYSPEEGVTFECSLDAGPFGACSSPKEYTNLGNGEHVFEVRATDASGNVDPTPARRTWYVDATKPTVEGPAQSLVLGTALGAASLAVPARISWSATDEGSGVARYWLQTSVNGGPYYGDIGQPSELTGTITPSLEPGTTYQYRVRAEDKAGNWSLLATGPSFTVDLRQEDHQAVSYAGKWNLQALGTASGGYTKYATASGAKAKFSFAGRNVAWVAPKGPNRGKATVWIDGVKAKTVDLYSPKAQQRQVVFTKGWASSGNHTLEIRATGTKRAASSGKRVDVDAFVALR